MNKYEIVAYDVKMCRCYKYNVENLGDRYKFITFLDNRIMKIFNRSRNWNYNFIKYV